MSFNRDIFFASGIQDYGIDPPNHSLLANTGVAGSESQSMEYAFQASGFPSTNNYYGLVGQYSGVSLGTDSTGDELLPTGTYGSASIRKDVQLYNGSINSANAILYTNSISDHSFNVPAKIFLYQELVAGDAADIYDSAIYRDTGFVSGTLSAGYNSVDVSSPVSYTHLTLPTKRIV